MNTPGSIRYTAALDVLVALRDRYEPGSPGWQSLVVAERLVRVEAANDGFEPRGGPE